MNPLGVVHHVLHWPALPLAAWLLTTIQWAEADAGLTDDCQMRVCSKNMVINQLVTAGSRTHGME